LLGFALLCPWLLFFTELATVRIQEIIVLYRSYLWMIGFFAVLPFLCQKMTAKQSVVTLSLIALLMVPLTWFRLTTFSHPLLLWDDAIRRVHDDTACPMIGRMLTNRGLVLAELKRYPESIDDFSRAITAGSAQQKSPLTFAATYYNRGAVYLQSEQYQLALDDFSRIQEPSDEKERHALYIYTGYAYEKLHDLSTARQFYEKACLDGMAEGCEKQKKLEASIK
jgi:tetratricopeptide (TPR) repeat protein